MVPFLYRRISHALIEELRDKISSGESLALLGPRYVGKRHAMHRIRHLLNKMDIGPVLQIRLFSDPPLILEHQVRDKIAEAVKAARPELQIDTPSGADLFGPLDALILAENKPIFLLAANVDGMAHPLARRFLECVRTRVESMKLIVLLSGEDDIRDFVYGPKADFNCAGQYVLQDYAEDEFRDVFEPYIRNIRLNFEAPEEAKHYLWNLTDGNLFLARMVLWALIQKRARSGTSQDEPVATYQIPNTLRTIGIPGAYGAHVFRHSTQLILRDPDCWSDLENLIKGNTVDLKLDNHAPSRLELAGIAVREITETGAYLRLSSPLMQHFLERYYDERRLGDLYAGVGMWDKAFERYAQLDQEATIRPLGIDDRAEVESTISTLCASLYSKAIDGRNAVKDLFTHGCRYVLGFREITFWQLNTWEGGGWQILAQKDYVPNRPETDKIFELLKESEPVLLSDHSHAPELWNRQLAEPWNRYAIAAIIPALRTDQRIAVVISELEKWAVISRERERLTRKLLEHFIKSYSHANAVDGKQIRLKVRNKHVDILNRIFNSLGSHILNIGHVLEKAAEGLRQLEYRRVLFCLIDPEEKMIEAVVNNSDPPDINISEMRWCLDDYEKHIQSYVVRLKEARRVENAATDPLADQNMVRAAGIKSFVVVPILNPADHVIGTIHVEREDRDLSSWDEIEDLVSFGRQVAIAIEQIERVNLLESALDRVPESIVIADRTERPRYANKPAADLLRIESGWRERGRAQNSLQKELGESRITELITESLSMDYRLVSHIAGVGSRPDYRGAVLTDIIQDWRKKTVGCLLRIQDLDYFYKVFEATKLVAQAQDTLSALHSMLSAAQLLGHQWGRLYLADNEDNPQLLVSKLSFGCKDAGIETEFSNGNVILAPRNENHMDWWCIERKSPLVLCWKDDLPDGAEYVTTYGLKAINVLNPSQPEQVSKRPGDFWIDFPLITQEKTLGKLCLQCDEHVRPENFELLKALSEAAMDLFDAFIVRARAFGEREELIKVSVAEKTMAAAAHNICTRLGSLSPLLDRYRVRERKLPELEKLNDSFSQIIDESMNTVRRAKELLAPRLSQLSKVDLKQEMESVMGSALSPKHWTVEIKGDPIEIQVDRHLFGTALLEMVQNSKDMATKPEDLHISICAEVVQHDSSSGPWIKIIYKDNGPGIPDHLTEEVFKDFFSYRPGRKKGTGLGLGFVRRVIKAHEGFIYTEVALQGAEFAIALPKSLSSAQGKEEAYVSYLNS